MNHLMPAVALWLLWYSDISLGEEMREEAEVIREDFCLSETFQPRCLKNEIILMKSATYGRMRIGRCITAEEIDNLRSHHLGCSENLLSLFDQKCSGKTDCEVRIIDISAESKNPCPRNLNVYLEVSYDCISNERRSCAVEATANPIHIISSTSCGTNSHPWIIEAPVGQKLTIGLIEFTASDSSRIQVNGRQSCRNRGSIVDKAGKTNVSICAGGAEREKRLYSSTGNSLQILLTHADPRENNGNDGQFLLRLQAVGCSNIIPPVDGYAKRNGDAIMIGCYASRKTWHLNCEDGKWVGVIGNCSQGPSVLDQATVPTTEPKASNEQVLIFFVIGGFSLAVCLAIICLGIVCLRRFRVKGNVKQEHKSFDYNFSSTRSQPGDLTATHNLVSQAITGGGANGMNSQHMPTYSVFVEDKELNDDVHNSAS